MQHRKRFYPWRRIWLQPGPTIRRIAHENPQYGIFFLPVAAGLANWPLDLLMETSVDWWLPVGGLLLSYGIAGELLQVFLGAYLLYLTGSWIGGKGTKQSLRVVVVWANVPLLPLAFFAFVGWVSTESGLAKYLEEYYGEILNQGLLVLFVGVAVLVVWSFCIFFAGLRAVQEYSVRYSLLNGLLAFVCYLVLVLPFHVVFFGQAFAELFSLGVWGL